MQSDVTPERARQILAMLTDGSSMDHINTSLALRLIPLASELEDEALVERLLNHAMTVAQNDSERGWARFESLKLITASVKSFLQLAEEAEDMEDGAGLAAAVHHYIALVQLAEDNLDEARTSAQRALRLRESRNDMEGTTYGLALLMTVAKRQHDYDTAIAIGTERLELLTRLRDEVGQMEAVAELAHCQATLGEFNTAQDLYNDSLDRANGLESITGQLVARWGLADIAEIQEDYESAMLVLSDSLHAFIAANVPAPAQVRQRIHDLTTLNNAPKGTKETN